MARDSVTEAGLGLTPTDEEMAAPVRIEDDDIGQADDVIQDQAAPPAAETPPAPKPDAAPQMVDVRAVQEARAEAREAKQHAAMLEQRWNDFLAVQAPKPAEKVADAIPVWNQDPMAAGEWSQQQLIAMNQEREATAIQQQQARQQEQQFQQAFSKVDADYTAAVAADSSVKDAYDKLRESQGKELLAMGYTMPQAQAQMTEIERQHIQFVASRGLNIGEYVKNLAAARGWQAQAAAAPAPKNDLAAIAGAQQRHQSLSDAPGGEVIAPLDAKSLAKMTDKQFKTWMSQKGNEAKFNEIMGH